MKKLYCLVLGLFFAADYSFSADYASTLATGPAVHPAGLFTPLKADPRELHFGLRWALPQDHKSVAEVAIGGYYGIYRWTLPGGAGHAQVNIGGGIFPRFIFPDGKDLQAIDFYGSLPFDFRLGKWSGRFMFYHVSSHLGDDYLNSSGRPAERNSWNSLRSLISYDVVSRLRIYAGYTYHLQVQPAAQNHAAFQGGCEMNLAAFNGGRGQVYAAADVQSWDRREWRPSLTSQIGVKMGRGTAQGRGISYFAEFSGGPKYYGQFFLEDETRVGVGAKFDIN